MLIIWRSLPKILKCCPSLMQLQNPERVILPRKSKRTGKKRHLAECTTQIGKFRFKQSATCEIERGVSRCINTCTAVGVHVATVQP